MVSFKGRSRKLRTFLRMSVAERRLIYEATLMLALARLIVLTVPFRLITPWLRRAPATESCDQKLLLAVRRALTIAARNVPWSVVCLPKALAAKVMLARRGCGSAFHLGATFDSNGRLIAHAWLVADGQVVIGAPGISGMSTLARFG
jgi:Transglutaminase-like superfamily